MALGRKPIEIVEEGKHQLLAKAEHWDRIFLKEVAKVQNGFAFSSSHFSKDEGMPLIRIRDIDKETTVDKYRGHYSSDFIVRKGDILIGMDGDFKAARWKGKEALLNQRVCRIIPFSEVFDAKFLFLCLQPILDAINAETSSVTVKHLSSRTIEEIPLPFPPFPEQQEIVAKIEKLLSELDQGKKQLEIARQQLKVYRQAVLKLAFEGKLTNPEITEGELPEDWNILKLADACLKIQDGSHFSPQVQYQESGEGRFMYITAKNIRNNYMDLTKLIYVDKEFHDSIYSRCNPEYGDVLLTKDGVNTGEVTLNTLHEPFSLLSSVCIMKTKGDVLRNDYLKYYIQSPHGSAMINNSMTGTAIKRIVLRKIRSSELFIPGIEEQTQIVQEIESRLSVCDKVEETIAQCLQQAETLRQSILKQAFEGNLVKKRIKVSKPRNEYFYQVQLMTYLIYYSNMRGIHHGEMTAAKFAYLLQEIYGINTYFNFKRWHLGPYAPEMKKVVKNTKFFTWKDNALSIVTEGQVLNYSSPIKEQVEKAINELSHLIKNLPGKINSHKIELFATVCKVIEDIQSTDLQEIRASMAEWKIDLATSHFKTKAEKFSEEETAYCLKVWTEKVGGLT